MQQKILLTLICLGTMGLVQAQKTAFAITANEKGQSDWKEIRVVDVASGEVLDAVYQSNMELPIFNARTGKAIAAPAATDRAKARSMKPFATNSAACAYDKKHDRLYYTPMNIAELRYIDLKGKSPKIYYFEGEKFGALAGPHDVQNQITRMAIGSDGNGYALTNNAQHLVRFTTSKKPEITDLGALTDDPANGYISVSNSGLFGGDMIADNKNNLYLITANRAVFKISIETRVATYKGQIQGVPRGYSTNGAVVLEGTNVLVCSSNATDGYYQFDMTNLQATKVGGSVYNASDLANGNLLTEKRKKKEDKKPDLVKQDPVVTTETDKPAETVAKPTKETEEVIAKNGIAVFPNPVTTGMVKISFGNQPRGRYTVQLLDISARVIHTQEVVVSSKSQLNTFRLPEGIAKGTYLVRVQGTETSHVTQVVVQ
jgi:hypothetical protein